MKKKQAHSLKIAAILVAAGRGVRAGGNIPKQYQLLNGRPLISYSIEVLTSHRNIDPVRTVYNPMDREVYQKAVAPFELLDPVRGGATRQESVRLGLESLADHEVDIVLIHDAARPFLSQNLIDRLIETARETEAVIPALKVADTLKKEKDGFSHGTVDRAHLWRAQTPQAFDFRKILAAHRELKGQELTDDAAVAERFGLQVRLMPGEEENFKVTEADDFLRAERFLSGGMEFRTGYGLDVHQFCAGDHVMLCGVKIPHSSGLEGHSDADVGLHALTDALLGAAGLGDIGQHFPPTDDKWKNADSADFLRHATELLRVRGGKIINVDLTLVCENPKIGPHREVMIKRLAEILEISEDRINLKATTTEKLGFTGREEGMAGHAIANLQLPFSNP